MPSPRSSRARFREFVAAYRAGRVAEEPPSSPAPDAEASSAPSLARRDVLRSYRQWLRPHTGAIAGFALLAIIAAALDMLEPLFMRFIIDRVVLATDVDRATRIAMLNLGGGLFLATIVGEHLFGAWKEHRQRLLDMRVMLDLRRALFDRFLHLPLPRLWEMKTGGILSRLTGDVDTTAGLLQLAIVSPALSVLRLVIAVGILLALNWRLALAALAVIPGAMLLSLVFARRIRPIYRSVREDVERTDGRVGETFSGIRVVRGFGREALELLAFLRGRHTIVRKEMFAKRRELVLWTSWGLLVGVVNVVIVWYGGWLTLQGRASVGDVMAFQWYSFLLLGPVWNLVNSFSELQRSLAATERVFGVLSMDPDKPDRPHAVPAPSVVRTLRFEGVGFAYRTGEPVLHDVNLEVPGGSVVALVGRSGAGKTTLTDLVARFHDPTEGRILLNGIDLRDLTLRSWRSRLAIVQQDVFLFDGSVAENLAYGRLAATPAEIEDAARRANAHEFIARLPQGYDTTIGERGVKLSGGQQQRLALARAILANPQVLILDEATSNLDTESEQLIQAAMAELLAHRTTFVIAHRLSTIRRADQILLLEHGRIIERGTHAELMAAQGAYAAMVRRQAEQQDGDLLPAARPA